MQFTLQALSALAASLLFSAVAAVPRCQPGEAWPDVHDCHNFFECAAGGIPVLKTCGPGTAYCPVTGVCDYEFKIPSCHPHGPSKGPGAEGQEHSEGPTPKAPGAEGEKHSEGPTPKAPGAEGEKHSEGPSPKAPGAESHERPQGPAHGWASVGGHHGHGPMGH